MKPSNILTLPGWQGSGVGHWQTLWEHSHHYCRVEQHHWNRPLRGDWITRLEEVLLGCDEPAVLVAHSLGCVLTAAWASVSRNTRRVRAALLVAPPDLERPDIRPLLPTWTPLPLQRLPFPSVVVASTDDPYCAVDRAQAFAAAWGAQWQPHGPCGHINADSHLGSWPEGHVLLQDLMKD